MRLVSAGELGAPTTETTERATTLANIVTWLEGLREDIARGKQALEETSDADLAARIRAGLDERKAQYTQVEAALHELEGEAEATE